MTDNNLDLDSIFMAALKIESPAARATFLDQACGDNQTIRKEVDRMLSSHGELGSFLEQPAMEFVAANGPAVDATQVGPPAPAQDRPVVAVNGRRNVLDSLGHTVDVPAHRASGSPSRRRRSAVETTVAGNAKIAARMIATGWTVRSRAVGWEPFSRGEIPIWGAIWQSRYYSTPTRIGPK